jgi:alpha-beta hydrolase superfamily lysophospholipase
MQFMADNGFVVCGNDCLGHGETVYSTDELGYFAPTDGWQCAVKDLHRMTLIIKREFPSLPCYMLGHSMGSFMARAYAIKYPCECDGFVFAGTADGFETEFSDTADKAAKLGDRLIGGLSEKLRQKKDGDGKMGMATLTLLLSQGEMLKRLKGENYRSEKLYKIAFGRNNSRIENCRTRYDWVSRDEETVDSFSEDPLCNFTFTVNGFINLASVLWYVSNDKWYMKMPKDVPILLVSGDCDPIGNYGRGVTAVYNRLCGFRCNATLKLYPDARHELLNEINRDEVYGDILDFLLNAENMYGNK